MHGLALCAGIGGLELGLSLAIGGQYRCVGYVERDAYAAAALVARMEDETLDSAPIWDDLETFDGRPWRGAVDIVSAGFPCQPWSVAGSQQGRDDARWIWPSIARIIRDVRPGVVFLENVPGLVSGGGLDPVLGDLAKIGFDAAWRTLRASDVGAPHRRGRVFILAGLPGAISTELRPEQGRSKSERAGAAESGDDGEILACADGRRWRERESRRKSERGEAPSGRSSELEHAIGPRRQAARVRCDQHAGSESETRGRELANPDRQGWNASEPDASEQEPNADGRGATLDESDGRRRESERIAEHAEQQGERWSESHGSSYDGRQLWPPRPGSAPEAFPAGLEPAVRRMADGFPDWVEPRSDRLRCLGNGVVPIQAAMAFRSLWRELVNE